MPLSKVQAAGIDSIAGVAGGSTSNIKERLAMLCDGGTYTVSSGSYTSTNVTAGAGTSSSFSLLGGSTITYTPPAGTVGVLYEFIFQISAKSGQHNIFSGYLMIDGTEVTDSRTHIGANSNLGDIVNFKYLIPIGGSASTTTGRQATWTSGKELKVECRRHGTSNEPRLHETYYYDGNAASVFHRPSLVITAIG
tara:strand:- start:275 stop:856 length:582 start_codon:yes stop_codon:yes gene_type:complete